MVLTSLSYMLNGMIIVPKVVFLGVHKNMYHLCLPKCFTNAWIYTKRMSTSREFQSHICQIQVRHHILIPQVQQQHGNISILGF